MPAAPAPLYLVRGRSAVNAPGPTPKPRSSRLLPDPKALLRQSGRRVVRAGEYHAVRVGEALLGRTPGPSPLG